MCWYHIYPLLRTVQKTVTGRDSIASKIKIGCQMETISDVQRYRPSKVFKGVRAVLINKRLVVLHVGQWRSASFHSFCTIPRRREPHASALPKYIGGCTISHSVWVFKFYEKWNIIQRLLTATHHTNLKKICFSFECRDQKLSSRCSSDSLSFL